MRRAILLLAFLAVPLTVHADDPQIGEVTSCAETVFVETSIKVADATGLAVKLLDSRLKEIPTNVKGSDDGILISRYVLTANHARAKGERWVVVFERGGEVIDVKPVPEPPGSRVVLNPRNAKEFSVAFDCPVPERSIQVMRDDAVVPHRIIARSPSGRFFRVAVDEAIQNGDVVDVVAETTTNAPITAKLEAEIEMPDQDAARVYASAKLEVGDDTKPNILADLTVNDRRFLVRPWRLHHGPALAIDVSTQDDKGEGSIKAGWNFRRTFSRGFLGRVMNLDIGPALELDDGLNTRNAVADFRLQGTIPNPNWKRRLAIGLEAGKNLATLAKLEDDFSGYEILRPTFDALIGRADFGPGDRLSFDVLLETRFLLTEEPDTVPLPRALQTDDETTTLRMFENGFKIYAKGSLKYKLADHVALALELERGEKPPLYGEENKAGLAIVFAY